MTSHTKYLTRALAMAVTTVSLGLLGCAPEPESTDAPPQTATESTESTAPQEETPTAEPTPETSNPALPADFPAAVPLVSENIERVKSHNDKDHHSDGHGDGHGEWIVWVTVDDIAASAATARTQLTEAGFAEESWHTDDRESKGVFKSADYGVILVAVDTPHHSEFMYKVFTK